MTETFIRRPRILFFAHAVTLAHFVRLLRWCEYLEADQYEIYFASHSDFKKLITRSDIQFIEINCINQKIFAQIVDQAKPLYDNQTFSLHVDEDMKLMEQIKPDVVVGDFRHSLSVSCRLKKIKYINLTNAYWSPEIKIKYPMPEAPIVRFLGEKLFSIFLAPFTPLLLKINFFIMAFIVRKSLQRAGLQVTDYRQVITDGDITAYCDTQDLVPLSQKSNREVYVGPVLWTMPTPLPSWWTQLNENKKKIFVSLGSSGHVDLVPLILKAIEKLDVDIIVALAGKKIDIPDYKNVFTTDFLPLDAIFGHVSLVICNGGSPLTHLAMNHGAVPCLGIVCNNDQLLNMVHLEARGAGLSLRYWNMTQDKLLNSVKRLLNEESFKTSAIAIQKEFQKVDVEQNLRNLIRNSLK